MKPRVEPAATGKAGAKKSKSASSKPDGPAPSREPLVLRSHHDCLLRALTQANEDGEHLVQLIFGPTRKHWWAPDGTLMMEATTHKQCKHKLEFALKLLHGARKEAMSKSRATTDTLSHSQMATGISWLHDVFRGCYLKKLYLGDTLDAWDEGCDMTRDEKTYIKQDFRSSFRVFLRELATHRSPMQSYATDMSPLKQSQASCGRYSLRERRPEQRVKKIQTWSPESRIHTLPRQPQTPDEVTPEGIALP